MQFFIYFVDVLSSIGSYQSRIKQKS